MYHKSSLATLCVFFCMYNDDLALVALRKIQLPRGGGGGNCNLRNAK